MDVDLVALAGPLMASPLLYPLLVGLSSLDGVLPMVPSEAVILAAGVFAHGGSPNLGLVIVATAVGVLIGDHLAYGLGRSVLGPRLVRRSTHVSRAVAAASKHLDRHALLLIVASRFLSGGRVTMNLACGTARLPLSRFSPASGIAALAWAAYTAGLGFLGGAAFAENPLLGIVVGIGLSVVFAGILDLLRRRTGRRTDRPEDSAGPGPADRERHCAASLAPPVVRCARHRSPAHRTIWPVARSAGTSSDFEAAKDHSAIALSDASRRATHGLSISSIALEHPGLTIEGLAPQAQAAAADISRLLGARGV
jgi:membrane-associated protein